MRLVIMEKAETVSPNVPCQNCRAPQNPPGPAVLVFLSTAKFSSGTSSFFFWGAWVMQQLMHQALAAQEGPAAGESRACGRPLRGRYWPKALQHTRRASHTARGAGREGGLAPHTRVQLDPCSRRRVHTLSGRTLGGEPQERGHGVRLLFCRPQSCHRRPAGSAGEWS